MLHDSRLHYYFRILRHIKFHNTIQISRFPGTCSQFNSNYLNESIKKLMLAGSHQLTDSKRTVFKKRSNLIPRMEKSCQLCRTNRWSATPQRRIGVQFVQEPGQGCILFTHIGRHTASLSIREAGSPACVSRTRASRTHPYLLSMTKFK